MKTILRFFAIFMGIACMSGTLFAQAPIPETWADVILEENGDTVVVKPSSMAPGYLNTMFFAIMGDTTETGERKNEDRVYETLRGHSYIYDAEAKLDASVPKVRIVAKPGTDLPPLHYKTLNPEGEFKQAFYSVYSDWYMENQYIEQALINDTRDRSFWRKVGDSLHYEFKNCIIEMSNWCWLKAWMVGCTYKVTDCLIMNIGAEASLEKGNIIDGPRAFDTIWFENNTILNCGNFMITRPNAGPSFLYFNHNTIVNATNNPFLFFSQAEMIATNNIFVNTGIVPDYPGFYPFYEDEDKLPKGIINADTLESAWVDDYWNGTYPVASDADRKILVDRNSASWDSRFKDMFENDLAPFPDSINEVWAHQMMTMNTRTQAMFDDDAAYPYFNEGHWYMKEPDFINNKDLVVEWANFIVTNAIPGNPNGGAEQATTWWRTNAVTQLVVPDWPILPDLSYTDGELASGGVNDYPLGDLNWFPSEKLSWEATNESEVLIAALKAGELPDGAVGIDNKEMVIENIAPQVSAYPNPFDNSTTVRFEIASGTNAQLIVYNIQGQRVRVMDLGYRTTGIHETSFVKGDLNPGMYILQINTDYNKAGLTTKISLK